MKQNGEIFSVKSSGILLCILVTTAKVVDVMTRRLIGNVVDKGIEGDFGVELFVCIAIICVITLLLQYFQPYFCANYETKYTSGMFIKIINSFLLSKQCEIDEKNVGEVSTCFSSDVNGVFQFAMRKYTIFFPDTVSFIVCVFFLMRIQRSLGIITLCVGFVSGFCMTKISKSMFSKMNDYQNKLKDINKFTSDGLINVEMIKVNLLTEKLGEQYEQELIDLNNIKKKLAMRQAVLSAPSMILSFSTLMTVAFYGGYCVLNNSFSIGSLLSAIILADYIVSPIMRLENTLVQYRRSLVNQANINKIIEMNLEEEKCNCFSNSEKFSFKNVSFSYPDNRMVFNDLNLTFTKGEINYILGKNGVGKTTFIKLLNGVYETNKGEISLPFGESSLSKIRDRISVMPQESLLFADTIKNNIFKEGDSEDKFQELCKKLNLESEIMSFGNGYDTILQENGDPLSGGQKKRICFLRCVMNEADIYVFDEPTANVDQLNANVMMDYIVTLSKDHYVVLITHDKDLLDKYPGYIQEISGGGGDCMTKDIKKLCIFFSLFQSLWLPYIVTTLVVASRNFIITVLNASISSKAVEMVENGTFYSNVLVQMGIWIVIFAFYDSMGIFSQTTIIHRIGVTLRKKMFSHVLHAKVEKLDLFGNRQELMSRMNYDIDGAIGLLSYGVLSPIMCCISGIGASVIVFRVDWKLCLVIYWLGAVIFWSQCKLAKAIRNRANLVQKRKTNLFSFCMQIFNNSSLIRISNLYNYLRDKLKLQTNQYYKVSMDKGKLDGVYGFIQGVLRFVCFVGIFCYCYFDSNMRLANIVYIIQIAPLICTMILSIADMYAYFQKSMVNVDRVLEIFEIPLENEDGINFEIRQENLLAAKNVICKYEDCSVKILNFSLNEDYGNMIAFTGPSGCGKTTLLRMLLKLYEYSEGSLLLFSQEIKECNNSSLRSQIAYVPQENMIFPGSVRQNILFGNENANISDAKIYDIFSKIGANDFFDFVGLDTSLTENGTNLSGGQRQIIAIARAILYDKPIMILDETFASIDIKYTSSVLDYLVQSEKYIIIVSHSDNILNKCSKVIVMNSTVR